MAYFSLDKIEQVRAKEFRDFIRKEFGERHFKTAQFEYVMSNNGIGTHVKVREVGTRAERDITNYDSW